MRNQAFDSAGNRSATGKEDRAPYDEIGNRQPVEERTSFVSRMPVRAKVGPGASIPTLLKIQQAVSIEQAYGKAIARDAQDLANCAAGIVDKAKGGN